jgi:tetratricopeptide (TPR) repeat protein
LLAPENAWSRYVQARWYLFAGNPAAFAAELAQATELVEDSQLMFLVAESLDLIGQSARGAQLVERALRLDPGAIDRYRWALQQTYFFTHRFEEAAAASEAITEPDDVDALYATLAYAQLGRAADIERWRARLLAGDPDFSGERFLRQNGGFVLPQAAAERALWLDSLAKAGLPTCVSPGQLAAGPMPECEAERAEATAKTL